MVPSYWWAHMVLSCNTDVMVPIYWWAHMLLLCNTNGMVPAYWWAHMVLPPSGYTASGLVCGRSCLHSLTPTNVRWNV